MTTPPASERELPVRTPAPPGVFLVGFMGAGKTTIGQALARQLGWPFVDLDDRIQGRQRRTIAEIIQQSGEAAFRVSEREALRELLPAMTAAPYVVALGGGAFAEPETLVLIESSGFPAVFLDAPVEELWRRCRQQAQDRPLRGDPEQFRALFTIRHPYYLRASLRVETSAKPIETSATEVSRSLKLG